MVVDVVALRPFAGRAEESLTGETIATGLRNEVHRGATDFGLPETAGERDLHFLRVGRVDDVAGCAAAVECGACAQAIDVGAAFVAASAVAVEDAHRGHQVDLVAAARDGWHQEDQRVVAARRRECVDRGVVDDLLPPCALHVDGRRLASHRNRFLQVTDLQVLVDRDDAGAGDFDTIALHNGESRQRECQAVGAGQEFREAITSRAVAHRGANLFDEDRTGGLNRNARQHRAGGVPNRAGNGRLRVSQRWHQGHQRHDGKTANEPNSHATSSTAEGHRKGTRATLPYRASATEANNVPRIVVSDYQ